MLPPSTPSLLGHENMEWPEAGQYALREMWFTVVADNLLSWMGPLWGIIPALRGPRALWEVLSLLLEEGTPSHAAHC